MPDIDSEVAQKRAIADYLESSNFARTAAQFTFGANGGAAAAVLSFITTTVNSPVKTEFDKDLIVHNFSIGCAFYVGGLLVAAFSMYFFAKSKKLWGDAWEDASFSGNFDFKGHFAVTAQKRENVAWLTLILSGMMLAAGSFFSLSIFLNQ